MSKIGAGGVYRDEGRILRERATRLAVPAEETRSEDETAVLVLEVGDEYCAVEVAQVREILHGAQITRVPCAAPYVMGVVSLRGEIVSVCDLGSLCGLAAGPRARSRPIVIVQVGDVTTGLAADGVLDIVQIPASAMEPALATIDKHRAEYITGEAMVDSKLVAVLNLEHLIHVEA